MNISQAYILVKAIQRGAFGWTITVYVLFLQAHGLSLYEANQVNSLYMAIGFLFDPFTGSLGDRFGHKKVYILGQAFWAAAMCFYGFSSTKNGFYFSETLAALGYALCSEALEAWYRNTVGVERAHGAISKSLVIGNLLTIPFAVLGGYLGAKYGLQYPWFVTCATFVLNTALCIGLLAKFPETTVSKKVHLMRDAREIWQNVYQSIKLLFMQKSMQWLGVALLLTVACFQPINMFWAPILEEMTGQSAWLGNVWVFVALFTSLGSWLAGKITQITKEKIGLVILLISFSILPSGIFKSLGVVLGGFLFHEIGRGMITPLIGTYTNLYIPNSIRATASSAMSTLVMLGSLLGLQVFGFLTEIFHPLTVWTISATFLLIIGLVAFKQK